MSPGDQSLTERGPLKWPAPDFASLRPESGATYGSLLDADDDLAAELEIRDRLAARQVARALLLEAPTGPCDLAPSFAAVGHGPGLLILDGLVAAETRVGDRTATELLGAADLLQPPSQRADDLLERIDGWRVLCPTRLALLDGDFVERVGPWPQILQELLRRAGRRIANVDALRAIACQPRLEVRLVLLLWHFAARWGRVEPAGIRLTLPLTHRLLGQLASAERPSVSHALTRLAQAGLVTGGAGDLHLHGTLPDHLEALRERACAPQPHSVPARRPARRQIA
ncbi:MAG: hypothetical protein NVSMB51_10020 [Solirubrobacteraceae bacterium]